MSEAAGHRRERQLMRAIGKAQDALELVVDIAEIERDDSDGTPFEVICEVWRLLENALIANQDDGGPEALCRICEELLDMDGVCPTADEHPGAPCAG